MAPLTDILGRRITYLRLSVTERCDFRCTYCIAEDQQFAPRAEVLSLEELGRLVDVFLDLGVETVRLTGGEPLTRKGLPVLLDHLGRRRAEGRLRELTLTTNGSRLATFVPALAAAGVERVNVSVDTVDPDLFARITRRGSLAAVQAGIDAAARAGLRVKLNCVVQKGVNDGPEHLDALLRHAGARGHDITFIEVMPMGPAAFDFARHYRPLAEVRADLSRRWTLVREGFRTAGPSRYWRCVETGGRIGFIAATSSCFCAGCNRVRVTSDGTLYPCLGDERAVPLRAMLRDDPSGEAVRAAVAAAITIKPDGHHFTPTGTPTDMARGMNATGG